VTILILNELLLEIDNHFIFINDNGKKEIEMDLIELKKMIN